jgi:hypothetical protein
VVLAALGATNLEAERVGFQSSFLAARPALGVFRKCPF